jgi:putative phosphoribosyl transferase
MIYADRYEAGRALVPAIQRFELKDPVVLGLPRGGVPVAHEVALALQASLDTITVRKLGLPWQPELAIGAIASGGVKVLNEELLAELPHLTEAEIDEVVDKEMQELVRREKLYRGDWPHPTLTGRDVVLVDDGLATGTTMRAAAEAVLSQNPAQVLVAVPVGSKQAVQLLEKQVDHVVCLETPSPFLAIGYFYRNFGPTEDEEVRTLLADARDNLSAA